MKLLITVILSSTLLLAQNPPVSGSNSGSGPAVVKPQGQGKPKAGKQDPVKQGSKPGAPKQDPNKPGTSKPGTNKPGTKPVKGAQDPSKPGGKPDGKPGGKPDGESTGSGANGSGANGGGSNGSGTQDPLPEGSGDGDDAPVDDIPIPAGSDPADLAAIRSAQAMLEAERKLARMIKEGKIKGLDKIVTFDELESWPYEDGLKGMPKRVKELDGKKVLMTGFMLPIDEVQNIREFLLVQSLWSCCYGQPPDINGIVRVVMPGKKRTDYFFDPLKIIGTFKVEATMIDGYCVDIYNLQVESLEAIR